MVMHRAGKLDAAGKSRAAASRPTLERAQPHPAQPPLSARLQPKLTVGRPDDIYEEEADRIADQVMCMRDPAAASPGIDPAPIRSPVIRRLCTECDDELQRRDLGPSAETQTPSLERVAATLRQPGRPLDAAARAFFEPRFGADFGAVRVHTDAQAAASAREVSALAYTVGRDVVFNTGQYAPHSESGRRLLAHELTHVIQQGGERSRVARQGPDAGTPPQPSVTIARQGGNANTFLSTDSISLAAQVAGLPAPDAGAQPAQVTWTVNGVSANAGNGNPHTATNQSNFSFTPNPTNRPTTGSRTANAAIEYRVDAQAGGVTASYNLQQDETDIIRQEYIDLGPVAPPARADIVAPAIAGFNTGNYSLIVDGGMNNALTNTETEFATLTQAAAAPPAGAPDAGAPAPVPVPAISVSSGYRNPRRNVAAGSQFPTGSRHVWGTALDLTVAGANATLWATLRQAGANAGNTSICEDGPTQKACSDPTIDHVHIQW